MGDFIHTLCNVVTFSNLALACIMKVPQITMIVKAGTTQGLSIQSLLMECWCFSILLAYPVASSYPFSAYMDMAALNIQDLIILLLVLNDRKLLTATTLSLLVGYISILIGAANAWLPSVILYTMTSTVPFIAAGGKLLQLITILRNKDAGAVSAQSWGIGAITAGGKVFTTSVLTGDKYLIFLSTQASILNGAVALSATLYPPKKKTN